MAATRGAELTRAPRTNQKGEQRQIRPHKKSRAGCKTCKFRKIKCDERRPTCAKCRDYGFCCDYSSVIPDFQLSVEKVSKITIDYTPGVEEMTLNMINTQLRSHEQSCPKSNSVLQLGANDLTILSTFQRRTVMTIGNEASVHLYRRELVRLGCQHPFLMHMILGMTTMHTRILERSPASEKTPAEAYHWFKAVVLFNEKLNSTVHPEDRDALWAVAVLLGASMFSSCEANVPEEAWPLKTPSATDLDWLRFTDGKRAIWELTEPLRCDSVFYNMGGKCQKEYLPCAAVSDTVLQSLPPELPQLCELHAPSNPGAAHNPYRNALRSLAPLLQSNCDKRTIIRYLSFVGHLDPDYRQLLHSKDPVAMLILAHWFAKVCRYEWWIAHRAMLECQAICVYIERHYGTHILLQDCMRRLRRTYIIPAAAS